MAVPKKGAEFWGEIRYWGSTDYPRDHISVKFQDKDGYWRGADLYGYYKDPELIAKAKQCLAQQYQICKDPARRDATEGTTADGYKPKRGDTIYLVNRGKVEKITLDVGLEGDMDPEFKDLVGKYFVKQTNWGEYEIMLGSSERSAAHIGDMIDAYKDENLAKEELKRRLDNEKELEKIVGKFQAEDLDDLYANIGASLHAPRDVLRALYPHHVPKAETAKQAKKATETKDKSKAQKPLTLRGLIPGMAVHYARCCHPLPGDHIAGIVTTGKGVTIHTSDCDTLESFASQPERWIDVAWDDSAFHTGKVTGRLNVVIANLPSALANLTGAISRANGNIINLKIINRSVDFFDVLVDVEVSHVDHLNTITAAIRATPLMISVERAKAR
jgi:hypothetical protein